MAKFVRLIEEPDVWVNPDHVEMVTTEGGNVVLQFKSGVIERLHWKAQIDTVIRLLDKKTFLENIFEEAAKEPVEHPQPDPEGGRLKP